MLFSKCTLSFRYHALPKYFGFIFVALSYVQLSQGGNARNRI